MSRRLLALPALLMAAVIAACSSGDGERAAAPPTPVGGAASTTAGGLVAGLVTKTFVDRSRATPANGAEQRRSERTLVTDIYYPARGSAGPSGAVQDAAVDRSRGPYPLVVFAHGLAEQQVFLAPLLERWAAAGYVVAAPHFPLTYPNVLGSIDPGDVQQQPGDISFVIDQLLRDARSKDGLLAHALNPQEIAVTGHSNGGITTLGTVANTCCRDPRIKAAIVMAAVDSPYAAGKYELQDMPPVLFVHGTTDALIDYSNSVRMFNRARGPKALLTLEKHDHGDWLIPQTPAFAVVVKTTTDFLDAYLRGDRVALAALAKDQMPGVATMHFAPTPGSRLQLPLPSQPVTNRKVTANPTRRLKDGDTVTVSWSGFLPRRSVNVLQCAGNGQGGVTTCDSSHGVLLQLDPTGAGSIGLTVRVGSVGNGVCDADHACTIVVNDSVLLDPGATVFVPITFAR